MADPDRLMKALRAAHAAGDAESAKRIAKMIKANSAEGRIEAAKAGTLKMSPERKAAQAEIDRMAEIQMRDPGAFNAFMSGGAQGVTLGGADEIIGGLGAIGGAVGDVFTGNFSGMGQRMGERYSDARDRVRALTADAEAARPGMSLAGQVVGSIVPGLGIAGPVAGGASLGAKVASGAALGAGAGGAQGFLSGEGGIANRGMSAAIGATGGAILGGAIPLAGAGIRAGLDRLANNRAVKAALASGDTPESLKAAASAIYKRADEVDNLPRGQFSAAVGDIAENAQRKGLDPDLTPGAAKVADRMATAAADESDTIGFRELDILRRKAAIPAGNVVNRTEQSIASEMVDGIDDFIDAVDPSLSSAIKEARDMWGRLRRSDVVSAAIEKAKDTASGFENGLRIEFRKILSNPKLRRGFNEREIEAIKRVVQGTVGGNLMRQVGRLGIGISGQSNAVGATMGGILGTTLGGPVGGLATVAGGTALKALSERSTRKAAENALATVLARNALDAAPVQQMLPGVQNALSAIGFSGLPTAAAPVGEFVLGRQ